MGDLIPIERAMSYPKRQPPPLPADANIEAIWRSHHELAERERALEDRVRALEEARMRELEARVAAPVQPTPAPPMHARTFPALPPPRTALEAHQQQDRQRIIDALEACQWNHVKASEKLGVPRRTFYRRLKEYGIQ